MEIFVTAIIFLAFILVLAVPILLPLYNKDRILIVEEGLVFYVKRSSDEQYLSNREDYWWSEKFRFDHCGFDTKQEAIEHLRKFYPKKKPKPKQNVVEVLKVDTNQQAISGSRKGFCSSGCLPIR